MEDDVKTLTVEDDPVRLYLFHVPGYVPGVARQFPGGSQAYVNDVTLEVLAEGPLGQPLQLPGVSIASPVQVAEEKPVSPAPVVEVQPDERGVAASSGVSFLTDADVKLGG